MIGTKRKRDDDASSSSEDAAERLRKRHASNVSKNDDGVKNRRVLDFLPSYPVDLQELSDAFSFLEEFTLRVGDGKRLVVSHHLDPAEWNEAKLRRQRRDEENSKNEKREYPLVYDRLDEADTLVGEKRKTIERIVLDVMRTIACLSDVPSIVHDPSKKCVHVVCDISEGKCAYGSEWRVLKARYAALNGSAASTEKGLRLMIKVRI